MDRFLGAVDRIVCTSPNYFSTSDVLTRFSEKVDVIPIGIDEASYPEPSPELLAMTERHYGRDFFLFVGVLRYYKGLHILLEAIKGAPYHVIIVGSGPTEAELRRQANELGLDNVTFTGYLKDEEKLSLFRLCRGVVFPSYMRSEAFGVTLLEGAMQSRPLVSTEVGSGTSHVNIDNKTGLVVPPGSPKALREAMDHLWYQPDVARHMGRNARLRYEQLFTGHRMATRYFEAYQQLIGNVPATSTTEDPESAGTSS
jgi:rhamnosyl/mannosyltransferase